MNDRSDVDEWPTPLFPAGAGMNRIMYHYKVTVIPVPRRRGDEPDLITYPDHRDRLFPAGAGMKRCDDLTAGALRAVPRRRGDERLLRPGGPGEAAVPAGAGMNRGSADPAHPG